MLFFIDLLRPVPDLSVICLAVIAYQQAYQPCSLHHVQNTWTLDDVHYKNVLPTVIIISNNHKISPTNSTDAWLCKAPYTLCLHSVSKKLCRKKGVILRYEGSAFCWRYNQNLQQILHFIQDDSCFYATTQLLSCVSAVKSVLAFEFFWINDSISQ